MFRFRRRVLEFLDSTQLEVIETRIQADKAIRYLKVIMNNQEVFDAYAAQIAEQNAQIKAAFDVIVSEISRLKSSVEVPLDTSVMDAAVEQLTAAVDQVESISVPAPASADVSTDGGSEA